MLTGCPVHVRSIEFWSHIPWPRYVHYGWGAAQIDVFGFGQLTIPHCQTTQSVIEDVK